MAKKKPATLRHNGRTYRLTSSGTYRSDIGETLSDLLVDQLIESTPSNGGFNSACDTPHSHGSYSGGDCGSSGGSDGGGGGGD